ncbi:MAG: hypothetical protein ACI4S4_06340, partial [Candidatus Ornithospirochaeta sp.]
SFLPELSAAEDDNEEVKKIIEAYNALKEKVEEVIESMMDEIFNPLSSVITSSEDPLWGDYVRCQLAVNVLGGVLETVEKTVEGVVASLQKEELETIDISRKEEVEALFEDVAASVVVSVVSGTLSSIIPPLAVYNNITSQYGEVLGMKPLTELLSAMSEELK